MSVTQPGAGGTRVDTVDDAVLADVLTRLLADAEVFGDGAQAYEAGVLDAVTAMRERVIDLLQDAH